MQQTDILLPVMALVLWTLCVLLLIPIQRFRAAFAKQVTVGDFKLGESANVPDNVRLPNRAYINLLEAPVLFYVLCFVVFTTETVNSAAVWVAWGYVALRMLHTLIHLTYNNVFHRLGVFATSNAVLAVAWVGVFARLVSGGQV